MSSTVKFIYIIEITCFIFSVKQSRKITATRFYFLTFDRDKNHIFSFKKFKIFAKRIKERVKKEKIYIFLSLGNFTTIPYSKMCYTPEQQFNFWSLGLLHIHKNYQGPLKIFHLYVYQYSHVRN